MHLKNTWPIALLFVIIAIVVVTMLFGWRDRSATPTSIESRFIDTTPEEEKNPEKWFELNTIADIKLNIEQYTQTHLPRIQEEIETYQEKIIRSQTREERKIYQEGLLTKFNEKDAMLRTLEEYQHLRTWYYENGYQIGNNSVSSGEVSVID